MKKLIVIAFIVFLVPCGAMGEQYYPSPDTSASMGVMLYNLNFSPGGYEAHTGDEVAALDSAGNVVGRCEVGEAGKYGFMAVYARNGEEIHFRIVDKVRKREYTVANTFVVSGGSRQFPSVDLALSAVAEIDTDGDGMCDYWEEYYGLDENSGEGGAGAGGDIDNDGILNIVEYGAGASPISHDTDGDSYTDPIEIASGTDPDDSGSTPSAVRVNFGPSASLGEGGLLDSYIPDSGESYRMQRGYGWQ